MEAEQSYWDKWYEENGGDLNDKRRERYHSDPEYREQVLERNREARREQRLRRQKKAAEAAQARKLRAAGSWKTVDKEVTVNGKKVTLTLYSIGALAKAIGRGISTVRVWERQGLLPKAKYRSEKGDRLYTLDQVTHIRKVLRRQGRLDGQKMRPKRRPEAVVRPVRFPDGEVRELSLYTVGALGAAIDRTVVSIKQMEKKGRIPLTPLRKSSLAHRLYTVEMIDVVRLAFQKRGGVVRGKDEWIDFQEEVEDGWMELGIMGAEVVEEVLDESEAEN